MRVKGIDFPVVNPGSFTERIRIEQPTKKQDDAGQGILSWDTVAADIPASIEMLMSREYVQAGDLTTRVTYTITMNWFRSNLNSTMRIVSSDGLAYRIREVNNVQKRNRLYEIIAYLNNPGAEPLLEPLPLGAEPI